MGVSLVRELLPGQQGVCAGASQDGQKVVALEAENRTLLKEVQYLRGKAFCPSTSTNPSLLQGQISLTTDEYQALVREKETVQKALYESQLREAKLETKLELVEKHCKETEKDLREQVKLYKNYLPRPAGTE